MKAKKTLVIIITLVVILAALVALVFLTMERVPENPAGTIGNTAGNLNNSGLVCERDGTVYFSNPYDGGSLYSMTADEQNLTKLISANVCNILADANHLYYFRYGEAVDGGLGSLRVPKSFNRSRTDGTKVVGITRDTVVNAQLVDNYLYILAGNYEQPTFYKIKIDKSEKVDLASYNINPSCAVNGTIYYNGTQGDHYLYALDTTTHVARQVWQGNLWYPVVEGDYVYYLDVAENYRLCRYSFSQKVVEVLTNDRVDCFNVGGGYIYYQKNGNTPSLNCMYTDGSGVQVVAEGNYTNINMTSRYVYFQEFGNDTSLYHAYLGSSSYSTFDSARNAAFEQ